MSLARRNLFQNKVRLLLSAAGVALSVILILVLNGFLLDTNFREYCFRSHRPV